jgi:CheY-like chemotaxis protein
LVVEDETVVRQLVCDVLRQQGYTILTAQNGQEALELSTGYAHPIHLLLTDVIMPKMSGKELAEQLTQTRPQLKVIFMSGYTDDVISHHGILNPDINFLQKPFSLIDMARKVREVLG